MGQDLRVWLDDTELYDVRAVDLRGMRCGELVHATIELFVIPDIDLDGVDVLKAEVEER